MNANTIASSAASMTIERAIPDSAVTAPAVALREVRKVHGQGDAAVVALDGISVRLPRGSFTAIMGRIACDGSHAANRRGREEWRECCV